MPTNFLFNTTGGKSTSDFGFSFRGEAKNSHPPIYPPDVSASFARKARRSRHYFENPTRRTMVDVFLVVSTVVAFFILFVIALYLLVYYQHPDDHNEAWIPKLVVIGGFVLAGATVLMLPLDVANNEGYAGTYILY